MHSRSGKVQGMSMDVTTEQGPTLLERFRGAHRPPTSHPTQVTVDRNLCNGCGLCRLACGGQLLEIQNKKAHFVGHPAMGETCIACRNCETACPERAVTVAGYFHVPQGRYRTFHERPSAGTGGPNPLGSDRPTRFGDIRSQLTEVERVVYTRRSNRIFKKRQIPKPLVERLLEAARFAPSAGNCQPWQFVVVRDRQLIDRIDRRCRRVLRVLPALYMGSGWWRKPLVTAVSLVCPNYMDMRVVGGTDVVTHVDGKGCNIFFNAPTVILVFCDVRGIGKPELDCGLAAQNLVLAAHALGLGTCYVGFAEPLNLMPRFRRQLGARWPYSRFVTSVAVGYPAIDIDGAVEREKPRAIWHERPPTRA